MNSSNVLTVARVSVILVTGGLLVAVVLWAIHYFDDCDARLNGLHRPEYLPGSHEIIPTDLDCDLLNTVWWPIPAHGAALVALLLISTRQTWLYGFRMNALALVALGLLMASDSYALLLMLDDETTRDDDNLALGFAALILFDLVLITLYLKRCPLSVSKLGSQPGCLSRVAAPGDGWDDATGRGVSLEFLKPSRDGKPPLIAVASFLALGVLGWIPAFFGTVRVWNKCNDEAQDVPHQCSIFLESWFTVGVSLVVWVMLGLAGVCGDAPEVWRPGLGTLLAIGGLLSTDQVAVFFNSFYIEAYQWKANTAGAGFLVMALANFLLTFAVCYRFPSSDGGGRGRSVGASFRELTKDVGCADRVPAQRKLMIVWTMAAGLGSWVVTLDGVIGIDRQCSKFDGPHDVLVIFPGLPTPGNCDEIHDSYWALCLSMAIFLITGLMLTFNWRYPCTYCFKVHNWQLVNASFLIVAIMESGGESRDLWPDIVQHKYGSNGRKAMWGFFVLMLSQLVMLGLLAYDVPLAAERKEAAQAHPPASSTVNIPTATSQRSERGIHEMIASFYRNNSTE